MNKIFQIFLIFLFLSNCSLDTKTGFWTSSERLESESKSTEIIFKKTKIFEKEFNTDIKINLKNNYKKNSFINNLSNNNGIIDFDGKLNKISKFKFSKIKQFDFYQPELLISNKGTLIFFDDKGTIFNFDRNNKLIWKSNVYKKAERKLKPILYFASNDKILVVADNLANFYALNINDGKLIWSNRNPAPFNSQLKIYQDKFYVIDFENVIRCISVKNGKELWNYKTEKSFIKSQQKLSLIINENKLVFINTLGDLSSIDINTGLLLWQTPTQSSDIYENYFSLKNSDLIFSNGTVYFSNNKNEFFAIDSNNGVVKWRQTINSNLRPTFVDGLVLTISLEGYFVVLDSRNGNILRITSIFDQIKNYKKKNIKPEGFIITKNKMYLSLNNGRLVVIDISNGKPIDVIKIDNEKISRPYAISNDMFIVKDNAIIKLN